MGIKTKKFNALSTATDGKLILANDNKLYQSTSSLSDILEVSGGTSYEAGQGIKIENDTISINSVGCVIANGSYGFAEGSNTSALGSFSHAEGYKTNAGPEAHSEGYCSIASGLASHAEGGSQYDTYVQGTSAIGEASHAEGIATLANGKGSHAEG